ncbi:2-alkyl-3-oxoalkanoate reductase [Paraconexibacter sp. AEG42_29]|uniref:2-alkyl-3-oxoalkanoate reductase n=1 Tax=Paraconexibacter sp. AEG42_29 TaxID=2997339 RepID=A0AAU7AY54_9ACTN
MDGQPLAQIRGSRIAVTGAGGFIGLATCQRLAADGAHVVGLDLTQAAETVVRAAGAEFRAVDVTDAAAVRSAVEGCDGVVHTAALVAEHGAMADFVRVNVGGTRNVLDAARDAGVLRAVHLSSVATLGYDAARDLPEDAPTRTTGAVYVDTKTASHELALGRGAAIVRPGDVYGPGSIPWTVRPVGLMRAGRFFLPGRGDGIITPIYVDDLVDCVVRALVHPDAAGRAYIAHDGSPVTAAEFFAHYARMLGKEAVPTLPRPVMAAVAAAEELRSRVTGKPPIFARASLIYITRGGAYPNARARDELDWEPRVDLAAGMERTGAWLREQGLLG